ncbi:MAG: Ig-like domain-containing protein, partial [Bacteroidales bacterium]|nr:Ig-like domain-containing protein [Bacteroidales bacterium]
MTATFNDGTTTMSYVPFYGLYADYGAKGQFIIPATDLAEKGITSGCQISKLKFFCATTSTATYFGSSVKVEVGEVANTTFSSNAFVTSSLTTVLSGTSLSRNSDGTVVVEFTSNYTYNGSNLLISVGGYGSNCPNDYWYGISSTNAGVYGYNSSNSQTIPSSAKAITSYAPKTTITYIPTTPSIILSPSSATILTGSTQTLTATRHNVTGSPTITYTSSNTSVATVSGSGTTATVTAVAEGSATITASMTYSGQTYTATSTITVIDACQPTWSGSNYYISNFTVSNSGTPLLNNASTGTAKTTTNYYATKSITAEPGDELSCTITMSSSGTYGFALWVDFDKDGLDAEDYMFETSSYQSTPYTGTFTIPANTPAGEYRLRILGDYTTSAPSNPCGAYNSGEAEDYKLIVIVPTCSRPTDLVVSNITNSSAKLTWTPGGDETQWEVAYNTTGTPPSSGTGKTTTTHTFTGLTANTQYYAHVRAKCSSSDYSNWVTAPFRTTQKTPATIPYSHGFEDTESSENGNWILTSGVAQTNSWCRGTAEKKTGSYGLYITNNKNGTPPPNAYSHTASYVYAYREVNFTSTGEYTFSFDWKANGESTYDLLRAFLVPINLSSDLSDGTSNGMGSNTNTTPSGWIDIANPAGKLNLQTSWQSSEQTINVSAGTYCLAFFWKNDGSGGTAPPAAVDNVSITTNAPPTYTITATANPSEGGTVTFMTGPASGATVNTHLPLDSYYDYGLSEQIYTPAEIGGGAINSIAFYSERGSTNTGGIAFTRTIDIYMAHTNKSAFDNTNDWISVSSG